MEIGFSFTKNCVYMQICAEMHLGFATALTTVNTIFHVNRFFVITYHNNLRNIDPLENSALRLTKSSELFPGFCRILMCTSSH